jgi:hypothetical protein
MPPKCATHGRPPALAEPQTTQENPDPLTENSIAQALNRMAEVMRKMTKNNRWEEHQPVTEGDRAMERFLKFNPPQFFGKPDSKKEAETWDNQIEDIFATLNYGD